MKKKLVLTLLCLFTLLSPTFASEEISIDLDDGQEFILNHFPSEGNKGLLWFPPDSGVSERVTPTAEKLAELGVETWIVDLHTSYFISPGPKSFNEVDDQQVAQLIEQLHQQSSKKIYLAAPGRSVVPALRSARMWQLNHRQETPLGGALLFYPNLLVDTPKGGDDADYLPITRATNLPIYIFQPGLSSSRWHLAQLTELLEESGSSVFRHHLPLVSDGFNTRDVYGPLEETMTEKLPFIMNQAMGLLERFHYARSPIEELIEPEFEEQDIDVTLVDGLKAIAGKPMAKELVVPDLEGTIHDLKDYKGKALLVNFWATWCPSCIREMPSLQQLHEELMDEPFEILAVNVGEPHDVVEKFVDPWMLEFPILLDRHGKYLRLWEIHAFPTTLILDTEGRLRYSFYGALEWDDPEIVSLIEELMLESQ